MDKSILFSNSKRVQPVHNNIFVIISLNLLPDKLVCHKHAVQNCHIHEFFTVTDSVVTPFIMSKLVIHI